MPSSISKNSKTSPLVSVLIPTLNSGKVLATCLDSIRRQTVKSVEIIIADGGSTDQTLTIARKFNCRIIKNSLKTGESGKAAGLRFVRGKYVALIDSDNILPSPGWLKTMLLPLETHPQLVGTEPWEYTYRPGGGFIERYSALTGVNDPYTLVAGNFDRRSVLHQHWTNLKIKIQDFPHYQIATLLPRTLLPTIGANGTIYRRHFLQQNFSGHYFFDVDILNHYLQHKSTGLQFAKVKVGIVHTFCESSMTKFARKQRRRATDLYTYRSLRTYTLTQNNFLPNLKFTLYTILILPMLWDTLRGFIKQPDPAWFFHPLACIITLFYYSLCTIKHYLGFLAPLSRSRWQQ